MVHPCACTRHADVHGVGGDVLVPEVREADRGGVQGPVVAGDAQAPNPLFVVEGQTTILM